MNDDIRLTHIQSGPLLEDIRALFLEYARALDFNLCFQNFEQELEQLPGLYGSPRGRLILCEVDGKSAACIALKPLESGVCELKRLFVRPEFRGRRLGKRLAEHVIREAHMIGYTTMRLDTIRGTMDNAIALYQSLGFKQIPPYYNNPIPNAFFMELTL
jgi:putative acetyltransferase